MPSEANLASPAADPPLRATYRLQLHEGFGFEQARATLDYLAALGVSHAYFSPCLAAARGSTHGYDVTDPTRVNDALGGHAGHDALTRALRDHGMGQIVDIVPNHMARSAEENPWWRDVLRSGANSRYARHFDVEWGPSGSGVQVVHLPVLGEPFERALEKRDVALAREAGTVVLRVPGDTYPLTARSVSYLEISRRSHESLDDLIARYNASPELMRRVLDAQHYRLHEWREGARLRNYRRFFDVDGLVALNVHLEDVFEGAHVVISRWLEQGVVSGVRVDHVDGLRDPAGYLERLSSVAPRASVHVEKILEAHEALPREWRTAGTTGYDFLNRVEGIFVDPAAEEPLTDLYTRFTGSDAAFSGVAYECKHLVLGTSLATDLARAVRCLERECRGTRWFEVPGSELQAVLAEYLARLPVYRTYVRPGQSASPADAARIGATMAEVARHLSRVDPAFLDFVASRLSDGTSELALLVQQTSGAVMAKGVEDTAFYRYVRFVALNEVGGDPGVFGSTVESFHARNLETAELWPETLLATATHDTKRGEDVRARLAVLSEVPEEWKAAVERWHARTAGYRDSRVDPKDEYAFYQTLVGAYPLEEARALRYVQKALREAKQHTSWTDPDPAYEEAMFDFVRGMLADASCMEDVAKLASRLSAPGRVNSLAKKLVALTAPGVPDVYQGTELWDLSLVDPDNRRPVDFEERRRLLARCAELGPEEIWAEADSGLPKLRTVQAALAVRKRLPAAFARGASYTPLGGTGERSEHVVAYARGDEVCVVAPRLVTKLGDGWGETRVVLPPGRFVNELTGDTVEGGAASVASMFARFPVALLARAS